MFLCGGELCLKTEYGNNEGRIDAYIVSSGEFFWGGSKGIIAAQRGVLVTPVEVDGTTPLIRCESCDGEGYIEDDECAGCDGCGWVRTPAEQSKEDLG
jgi:hypothetical protein